MKVLFIIVSITIGSLLLVFLSVVFYLSFQSRKQPPSFGIIEEKYYVCRQQKLLDGGVFGKGPKQNFPENNSKLWCWRDEWEEIDKTTFKSLATEWYEKDW